MVFLESVIDNNWNDDSFWIVVRSTAYLVLYIHGKIIMLHVGRSVVYFECIETYCSHTDNRQADYKSPLDDNN